MFPLQLLIALSAAFYCGQAFSIDEPTIYTNHPSPETLDYDALQQMSADLSYATANDTGDGRGYHLTGVFFHKTIEDYAEWYSANYGSTEDLNRTLDTYWHNTLSSKESSPTPDTPFTPTDGYTCRNPYCYPASDGHEYIPSIETYEAFRDNVCSFVGNVQPYSWAAVGYTASAYVCKGMTGGTGFTCGLLFAVTSVVPGVYVGPPVENLCKGGFDKIANTCPPKSSDVECTLDSTNRDYIVKAVGIKGSSQPSCPTSSSGPGICKPVNCDHNPNCK